MSQKKGKDLKPGDLFVTPDDAIRAAYNSLSYTEEVLRLNQDELKVLMERLDLQRRVIRLAIAGFDRFLKTLAPPTSDEGGNGQDH